MDGRPSNRVRLHARSPASSLLRFHSRSARGRSALEARGVALERGPSARFHLPWASLDSLELDPAPRRELTGGGGRRARIADGDPTPSPARLEQRGHRGVALAGSHESMRCAEWTPRGGPARRGLLPRRTLAVPPGARKLAREFASAIARGVPIPGRARVADLNRSRDATRCPSRTLRDEREQRAGAALAFREARA